MENIQQLEQEIKQYLNEEGKLTQLPKKRMNKVRVLMFIVTKFEPDKKYDYLQINAILNAWHTFNDPFTLRRDLVDFGFLERTRDGKEYWVAQPQPTIDEF